ncbi:hypothetical protein Trydic_g23117 [Trypoxylus dichotomus]
MLNKKFGPSHIPSFKHLINYYLFFSTNYVISNDVILFKIHVPIVSKPYDYFHFLPVYQNNYTVIPETPYILFDNENYWNTERKCSLVETVYFYRQEDLAKGDPCLKDILIHAVNHCPVTAITITKTLVQRISATRILVNPKEPVAIHSACPRDGLTVVHAPSLIDLEDCKVEIENKKFSPNENLPDGNIFTLPDLDVKPPHRSEQKTVRVSSINQKDVKHIKFLAENFATTKIEQIQSTKHSWTNTVLFVITLVAILSILGHYAWKTYRRTTDDSMNMQERRHEPNPDPAFAHLRDGGDIL